MNMLKMQQLRQSLKVKWLIYYQRNRSWLVKMRIWASYDGQRRPSSGFMLGILSLLEPQLTEILPFLLELNNNPDNVITALGLNFNPEQELLSVLKTLQNGQSGLELGQEMGVNGNGSRLHHPEVADETKISVSPPSTATSITAWVDEFCNGIRADCDLDND